MGVLGAALEVDAAAQFGARRHAVVAVEPQPPLPVAQAETGEFTEHGGGVHRVVSGGAHQEVDVQVVHLAGAQ
ncbi:hypothetical protein ACN6LA_001744 [Streptomyces sp. SAS_269]|uniref:hypothetical protein n=1 Tax=Streptomyces sp. SAS_269 TaxID=3412749 RepID=UPI00403D1576